MTKQKILHNLINVITVFLFSSFVLFESYTWGKFAFLAASVAIYILGLIERGKTGIRMDAFVWLNLVFIMYVLLTAFWAEDPESTMIMARSLFRTFACAYIVYLYFLEEKDIFRLLRIVMWAGYVVALYSLFFYGMDELLKAGQDSSVRAGNEFANVNSIGLCCALSCMIQMNEFLEKRNRWTVLLLIPTLVVMGATQSRKAFLFLIVGIITSFIIKNQEEKLVKKFFKGSIGCIIAVFVIYALFQLDIFVGVRERMQLMLNSFTGKGKVDGSTMERKRMIKIGLEEFFEYPIGGIGMANSYFITAKYLGWKTYLHNNFVELLACGGIFAFIFYYLIYVYLFYNLWKYRNEDRKQAMFFAVWLLIMLILDYGNVSYSSKDQNFYLMIHFINIKNLKRKAMVKQDGNSKICEGVKQVYNGQKLSFFD